MWPRMDTSESDHPSEHRSQSLFRFTLWHGLDVSHPYFGESRWAYTGMFAAHRLYGQSKLAQMYHARSVRSIIFRGQYCQVNHPGNCLDWPGREETMLSQSAFTQEP